MKNEKNILPEDFYKKNLFYDCDNKSMKARLGFLPCSIWKPDVKITKYLKNIINDKCQVRETKNAKTLCFVNLIARGISFPLRT